MPESLAIRFPVRRLAATAVAAAALCVPIVSMASHDSGPTHGVKTVALPNCSINWVPICDRL
jgi:hypothetical protein